MALTNIQPDARFQDSVIEQDLMTPTSSAGSPAAGTYYSSIVGRKPIVDLRKDLKPRMGIERTTILAVYQLQDEFGPNGEAVHAALNDDKSLIRFAGTWNSLNSSTGVGTSTVAINDFIEITFYGTGLNILANLGFAYDFRASIDGASETGNIFPATSSSVLIARNYAPNQIITVANGLSLGVHTVKLRNNHANGINFFGFDVINDSANVNINPGYTQIGNKKTYLASQALTAHNSAFESGTLGIRGGRVVVYMKKDGTIAKAIQPVNAAQANLTSASHGNEDVIRSYYFKEFSAGRSDDFSFNGQNARGFTLDDGTTTLIGSANTLVNVNNNGQPEGIFENGTGGNITFTFVGTGLDIYNPAVNATGNTYNVFVDGVQIATSSTLGATKTAVVKIVSGLPYGTHTFRISAVTTGSPAFQIGKFIVYGPKKPQIPAGAIELADYNIMANYIASTSSSVHTMGTGLLKKVAGREFTYANGTGGSDWVMNLNTDNSSTGFELATSHANSYFEYTFFGTGFEHRADAGTGFATSVQISLQSLSTGGSLQNATITNFPTIVTSVGSASTSFNTATGILNKAANATIVRDDVFSLSGLPLGTYKVRFNNNNAGTFLQNDTFNIITPIHSPKTNLYADIQNTLSVGSCGISDNRKLTPSKDVKVAEKAWAQAIGQAVNPTISTATRSPLADMNVTIKTSGGPLMISFSGMFSNNTVQNFTEVVIFVDGVIAVSPSTMFFDAPVANYREPVSDNVIVPVSAGIHKVEVYWAAQSGSISQAVGAARRLVVKEL